MEIHDYSDEERSLIEKMCVPMAVFRYADNRIETLAVSRGFCDMMGLAELSEGYDVMNNDMYRNVHQDDIFRVAEATHRFSADQTGEAPYEVVYRSLRLGSYHILHAKGKHVYDSAGNRYAYVWYVDEGEFDKDSVNITEGLQYSFTQKVFGDASDYRQNYDFLTGLPSMLLFFLNAEFRRGLIRERGQTPALLYLDFSGMNFFNRKHGFHAGDELLRYFAKLLSRTFGFDFVGRFGQDHFGVIAAADGLEKIVYDIFEEMYDYDEGKTLPIRVGIYVDVDPVVPIDTCCDRAKSACDKNRKTYFSHVDYFDETMLRSVQRKQFIVNNLEKAIAEHHIEVYYQPIIRAVSGSVANEEALSRWIDPQEGLISPADFIPVLEEAKLVSMLDLFVVEQVLEKIKRQAKRGLYVVPISVNLSRIDFDQCDMVAEISKRADEAGVDRNLLIVEITESAIGSDFDLIKKQTSEFRRAGFSVWMDDFGSGYSSLDVLQTMDFDAIKLDMRFVQQLATNKKSEIILSSLAELSNGLELDIIAEGVETKAQASFLRKIGCTKLQGYYFTRPIPESKIYERYDTNTQIGFENPAESGYYTAIGRINLNDINALTGGNDQMKRKGSIPMAVLEWRVDKTYVIRCNDEYKKLMDLYPYFRKVESGTDQYEVCEDEYARTFFDELRNENNGDKRIVVTGNLPDGGRIQTIIRRIVKNPVNRAVAFLVVVASVQSSATKEDLVSYANVAEALSADYFNLFYVNVENGHFIEYSPNKQKKGLSVARQGEHFFEECNLEAPRQIYSEDLGMFMTMFSKQNIIDSINERGTFTLSYRMMVEGVPTYVNMKAVRIDPDSDFIVIGVNNVDAQMRQTEEIERLEEERITFSRIAALSGDYICIYTVDPITGHYYEYSATKVYDNLNIQKEGSDFFADTIKNSASVIYPDDLKRLKSQLTKDKLLREIRENGLFTFNYRLMLGDTPRYVCLKATMIEEKSGPQILVGVVNIDVEVRRNEEYEKNLFAANERANVDALTGVRNKYAYIDLEQYLNGIIEEGESTEFAIVVCDINDLKGMNDRFGHAAGDEYIKKAAGILNEIFQPSPIYRVGGDEFAVVAQGDNYIKIDSLMIELERRNRENAEKGEVVVAAGMAVYAGDRSVSAVFERADSVMYKNKSTLKRLNVKR